jgi:hypothetical protein
MLAGAVLIGVAIPFAGPAYDRMVWLMSERVSVADRLAQFAPRVDPLWAARCREAGIPWPPARVRLLALKRERRLEVHAASADGPWCRLAAYPVLAASGGPGPKLRAGDNQVPEGLYRIVALNPNSRFHVSLRVDYPDEEDRAQALPADRDRLGGDIMIHGGRASIGCLAMGDPAIEEIFTLVARCGTAGADTLILPHDLRVDPRFPADAPPWMAARYQRLRSAAETMPVGSPAQGDARR